MSLAKNKNVNGFEDGLIIDPGGVQTQRAQARLIVAPTQTSQD